uniref:Uncharacterized protein n=1 Tax=Tanacetum cinerariifolium TaxID=118510 RepID=A0A6L2LAR8_TANCI|nr:hypothetical protein [Tanacetum cinerariifolium]
MTSPNHPSSNIEDAFSSNFPDYTLASPDYFPASPGKTYSSFSNNSFGLVLITLPTLLLFHDDPYMKVMHAYYAKESPIPTIILPPSPLLSLSPMFDSQNFFPPEEILPPKDAKTHVESPNPISLSSSVGSTSPIRANGLAGENSLDGANGSVGSEASMSTGLENLNEVGESNGDPMVEPRWVNDKSHDHTYVITMVV